MKRRITILLFCFLLFGTFKSIAQTFSAGNLVVLRTGDGTASLTTAGAPLTLFEMTPTGTTTSTVLSLSTGAAGQRIVTSGTAGLEGQLRLSVDGRYLSLGGYDAAPGTAQAGYETSTKIIVRIGVDGVPNFSTKIPTTDALNGATIRSAVSVDGSSFWVAGSNSTASNGYYLRYIQFGASSSTAIDAFGTVARTLDIFNGALYATSFSSSPLTKYPGLPTTVSSSSSVTAFNFSASEFLFLDVDKNPATGDAYGNDVLYAADISSGLRKFAYVGGAWVGKGTLVQTGGLQAFTGYINSSSQPVLYAVSGAVGSSNKIVSIVDVSGITGDIGVTAPTVTTLATAGTNFSYRGIAFAPSPIITTSGSLTALSTTYGTASGTSSFNVIGNNIVSGILVTPPSGFEVSKDNINFSPTVTISGSGSIASTPVYIRLASATAVGNYSGNIVLSSPGAVTVSIATVTSTVDPAVLNVKATDVSKAFGATLIGGSGFTAFTVTGLKNSETIGSVTITYGTGSASTSAAGVYTGSVVASAATGGTFNPANYTITYTPGNVTVVSATAPTITVTGTLPVLSTTYATASSAGSFNVSATNMTTGILVTAPSGYEVSINGATGFGTSLSFGSAGNIPSTPIYYRLSAANSAGTYAGNIILSSTGAANANVATGQGVVNPANLTITAGSLSKTYGQLLVSGSSSTVFTVNGLKNSETIGTVTINYGAGSTINSPVGTYTGAITASSPIGGTFVASNYAITYIAGNVTITPAALNITANNLSKPYGAANPTLTLTYSGFASTDGPGNLLTQPTVTTTAVTSSPVGVYPITVSGASSPNYNITYANGTLTVNKALLTITANSFIRAYGAANPALTVTYSGFVGSDNESILTSPPVITTTATASSLPGNYPITISGAAAVSYNINYVNGTISIAPATNANLSNLTINYGTLSPSFTATNLNYTASVSTLITKIIVTPTLADPNATVKINGTVSGNIPLNIGSNIISVVVTAQNGSTTNTYTITVNRDGGDGTITANNILTPNGDGKNDFWVIKEIGFYPDNNVKIYDRAGRMVFNQQGYKNTFDGMLNGSPLTEGTYYYTVDLAPGIKTIKGFITILKNK